MELKIGASLDPCEYCMAEAAILAHDGIGTKSWYVECQQCGYRTETHAGPLAAVRAWNQMNGVASE